MHRRTYQFKFSPADVVREPIHHMYLTVMSLEMHACVSSWRPESIELVFNLGIWVVNGCKVSVTLYWSKHSFLLWRFQYKHYPFSVHQIRFNRIATSCSFKPMCKDLQVSTHTRFNGNKFPCPAEQPRVGSCCLTRHTTR
jgi:hypothetical protein